MSTYSQIYLHIIFATKKRIPALAEPAAKELHRYIAGIIKEKGCMPFEINGDHDHVHLLTGIRQHMAPSDFVRDIKTSASLWIRKTGIFPAFEGWQDGYGVFSVSYSNTDKVAAYIRGQKTHHEKISSREEMRRFLEAHGIEYNPEYFA
jgi:putative transposase